MPIEQNRQSVLRLFNENFYPHIIGDLDELDNIQASTNRSACAVPTAMLILSTLEMLGYLLKPGGRSGASLNNIKFAIKYNRYYPQAYSTSTIKDLVTIYRHGMMHSFFPSNQTTNQVYGIHKSPNTVLMENITITATTIKSLNVNVLSKDFRQYINSLYSEIQSTTDGVLLQGICNKFRTRYHSSLITTATTTTQTTIPPGSLR
ncbi:hypothetical protein KXD93_24560 [Mucilaginibacter sp. BJC16-A38]|uniref:hypothetical protein n=1 Tax=Mucilaginibacter phenanthrenivorans TaxID=1234842 RepID=UPI00215794DA|nr:hypothetical protein [Mucilaginibacter phenanthrenivorans]MCR8560853.1 hypothetical protein [Mucilaginibacter phenanthrenivorans]